MPSLPTGTVTFLFTDIERSTRLLQQLGDRYAEVLATHHRLLRSTFQDAHGHEMDTQGDALFVAFPRAKDALLAAVAAQRVVQAHPWPDGITVRVRMGLHTGEPISGETGYVGMDVHRAARIAAAGHGGQILVSDATHGLVAKDLPEGVSLRDLGEHRLKDLAHPHRLFQVLASDLPSDFPTLRTLDGYRHNLPGQLTSFVGRAREMAEVKRALGMARLVTLTGIGGVGKTRLALQVAADLMKGYPDGVWLAELAPLVDPTLVPKAVASAVGVPEQPGHPMTETLADVLRPKALLVVLDNCEHLVSACAQLAEALLRTCPRLKILATSREALGMAAETLYPVPSLSMPDREQTLPVEELTEYEAIRLFTDRARAVQRGFAVTERSARGMAKICRQLDGIPLALELAAARVKVLPVEQIIARLDERFHLLKAGRTALPRHQTLRAAMDWSHDLLSIEEKALWRRLSVFAGGWTLEAAEAACSGDRVESGEVADLLTSLIDKSLAVAEESAGEGWYRLLETVRQYGRDRLVEAGETDIVRRRHRDWYLALAERAEPKLRSLEQLSWLDRLDMEHDNLRAALEWSRIDEGAEAGLRLAGALVLFWFHRSYNTEGYEWLKGALAKAGDASVAAQAKVLCGAGMLAVRLGEFREAWTFLRQSLARYQGLGDRRGAALSLHFLAHAVQAKGHHARARALFEQSVALSKEVGDRWEFGHSLNCLGDALQRQGDYLAAKPLFEESLALAREVGDKFRLSFALGQLGVSADWQGDHERAAALLEESLAVARQIGDKYAIAVAYFRLGNASLHRGNAGRAVTLLKESLVVRRDIGSKAGVAACLEALARAASAEQDPGRAARLLGAAETLRKSMRGQMPPADRAHYDRLLGAVREALGGEEFVAAWSEGGSMTLEQAIEYALNVDELRSARG